MVSLQRMRSRAKVIWKLVWPSNLHVILVPLVVLAGFLALGITGVKVWGLEASRNTAISKAEAAVDIASQTMQIYVQKALTPVLQVIQAVKLNPNVAEYLVFWDKYRKVIGTAMPPGALSMTMLVQGYSEGHVVLDTTRPSYPVPLGADTMDLKSIWRPMVIAAMAAGRPILTGPVKVPPIEEFVMFVSSISISNVSETETWGYNRTPTQCPPGLCYNNTTRTKWWGVASFACRLSPLILSTGALDGLKTAYSVQMWRPASTTNMTKVPIAITDEELNQPSDAVCTKVQVLNQEWDICVWQDSWTNNDLRYLYIVVVLVSLGVALMLFLILLSWVENRALLHSVLPKEAIARIRTENADWTNSEFLEDRFYSIEMATPAQHMLSIIHACLNNILPDIAMLISVRTALQQTANLYRPTADVMKAQMREAAGKDGDVAAALVAELMDDQTDRTTITNGTMNLRPTPSNTKGPEPRSFNCSEPGNTPTSNIHLQSTNTLENFLVAAHIPDEDKKSSQDTRVSKARLHSPGNQHSVRLELSDEEHMSSGRHKMEPTEDWMLRLQFDGVETILKTVDEWVFDIYGLDEVTQGHALSVLGFHLLKRNGLMHWARIDNNKLIKFLQYVEIGCGRTNPYHNARHTADVVQGMHVIMHRGGLMPGYIDNGSMLACYVAAIIHDYEHKGRSNDFLRHSRHELAITYNDRHPLEQNSVAAIFRLLSKREDLNFLSGLTRSAWEKVRELVITLVLATDMKQHFSVLGQFNALHQAACGNKTSAGGASDNSEQLHLLPVSETDKLTSLQMAIKCADLGHLTAPINEHVRWVRALEDEFFLQGDAERAAGMPLSPLCDRNKDGIFKSQVGFFDFVAMPLFKAFVHRFKNCAPMLRGASENQEYWVMKMGRESNGGLTHGKRVSQSGTLIKLQGPGSNRGSGARK